MIQVEKLYKWYGTKLAVDGVSFSVEKGDVLGFIGPNGAGKSTTMRMITGFIPPSEGTVKIGGYDIEQSALKAKALIGYLPESAPLYNNMTVRNFLAFCARVRGFSGKNLKNRVDSVIETCFLEPVRNQVVDTLSKGYKHRTCFAQSIIHDPDVLVLDEPTDGLDPNQKRKVRELIARMGESKAIILSTHILEEVEAVCSRVVMINGGKKIYDGTPDELRSRSNLSGAITLELKSSTPEAACSMLKSTDGVASSEILKQRGDIITVRAYPEKGKDIHHSVFEMTQKENWDVEIFRTEHGRLDEVFHQFTEDAEEASAK